MLSGKAVPKIQINKITRVKRLKSHLLLVLSCKIKIVFDLMGSKFLRYGILFVGTAFPREQKEKSRKYLRPFVAGVVVLYFICLKLATNDWIGTIPPGPGHIPYFGKIILHFSNIFSLKYFQGAYTGCSCLAVIIWTNLCLRISFIMEVL